jgi:hypothetical protein
VHGFGEELVTIVPERVEIDDPGPDAPIAPPASHRGLRIIEKPDKPGPRAGESETRICAATIGVRIDVLRQEPSPGPYSENNGRRGPNTGLTPG